MAREWQRRQQQQLEQQREQHERQQRQAERGAAGSDARSSLSASLRDAGARTVLTEDGEQAIASILGALGEDVAALDAAQVVEAIREVGAFLGTGGAAGKTDDGEPAPDDLEAYRQPPFAVPDAARDLLIKRFNRGDADD